MFRYMLKDKKFISKDEQMLKIDEKNLMNKYQRKKKIKHDIQYMLVQLKVYP